MCLQSAVFVGTERRKNSSERSGKSNSPDKKEFLKILRRALKTAAEVKIREDPGRFCHGGKI